VTKVSNLRNNQPRSDLVKINENIKNNSVNKHPSQTNTTQDNNLLKNKFKSYCDSMIVKTKKTIQLDIDQATRTLEKVQSEAITKIEANILELEVKTTETNKVLQQEKKQTMDRFLENQEAMLKLFLKQHNNGSRYINTSINDDYYEYIASRQMMRVQPDRIREQTNDQYMIPTTHPIRTVTTSGKLISRSSSEGLAAGRQ
jgi:hypothetical protein